MIVTHFILSCHWGYLYLFIFSVKKNIIKNPSNSSTQQSPELTVQKASTAKAEIRFLLHFVTTGQSCNWNDSVW